MMHLLKRADVMLYGDLTVRNKLNELYDIAHIDDAQTKLLGAADFADTGLHFTMYATPSYTAITPSGGHREGGPRLVRR